MTDGTEPAPRMPPTDGDHEMSRVEPDGGLPLAGETAHAFLRRVTRPWHDAVERAFERFDLGTIEGLSGFLVRQAEAVFPLERSLAQAGVEAWLSDWPARRRTASLAADLAHLGIDQPRCTHAPELPTRLHGFGALYVIEGSKLGGRVLHRRLLASDDSRVRDAGRYLGHHHDHGWSGFLAVLNGIRLDAESSSCLVAGARTAFAAFEETGRLSAKPRFAEASTRSGLYDQADA